MRRLIRTSIAVAMKVGVFAGTPLLVIGYSTGPPAMKTGAPGEGTCRECHSNRGPGGGKVEVSLPAGSSYSPGTKQRLTITITDSGARWFGFQLSARIARDNTQAGTLAVTAGESGMRVICANDTPRPAGGCPSTASVEYIEHSPARQTNIFRVDWTPPSADRGPVNIYIAANGANGNGDNTGDNIYTATVTLSPGQAPSSTAPRFFPAGIVNAATLSPGISPGSFITIFGENLAPRPQTWDNTIQGTTLPTQVEGVSVSVSGQPAYPAYVSAAQLNVLVGTDAVTTGPVEVRVTTAQGTSTADISMRRYAPGLFLNPLDRKYATATHADNTLIAKLGLAPASRPAMPGETVTLWGTGFGPTADPTPSGQVLTKAYPLLNVGDVKVTVGGEDARVTFAGMTSAGIGQINVVIPSDAADGDQLIVAELGGIRTQENVLIAVQGTAAVRRIQVAYRLDPWLISGNYGGGFWASPAVLGPATQGSSIFVTEIRAEGIDALGDSTTIEPEWIALDPEMLGLSATHGTTVTLTVRRAGRSILRVTSENTYKDLAINAVNVKSNVLQVDIAQR